MELLIKFLRNHFREGFFNGRLLNTKEVTDPIVRAIENKEIPSSVSIENTEDFSSPMVEEQRKTTEAIKGIIIPEPKEVDLTNLSDKIGELISALEKKDLSVNVGETKVEVDTKGIISSVERLQQAVEESKTTLEPQEVIDYTSYLEEIIQNIEKPDYDFSKIEEILSKIEKKEFVLPLDEKGRVKVSIDKVSMGGRGSLSSTESAKLMTLATEETQAGLFATRMDDVSTTGVTYIGKAPIGSIESDAVWQIRKLDESGTPTTLSITWADGNSNFDNVWSDRLTESYS